MAFSHPVELEPMIQKSLKTSSVQIEKFSIETREEMKNLWPCCSRMDLRYRWRSR